MRRHSGSPIALAVSLKHNMRLIIDMAKKELATRYQGTFLGLIWSVCTPLILLGIYTLVFSTVFQARWEGGGDSQATFATWLFVGLIIHALFMECIAKAPNLVLNNPNFVKKVVFPIELLPVISLATAVCQATVSYLVLLAVHYLISGHIQTTALLFPILLIPLLFVILGVSWLMAAFSVFLRDIGQLTGFISMAFLFLSPIFYPVSALPKAMQAYIYINPLTFFVEESRKIIFLGDSFDYILWSVYLSIGLLLAWIGYFVFQRLRNGFADVI